MYIFYFHKTPLKLSLKPLGLLFLSISLISGFVSGQDASTYTFSATTATYADLTGTTNTSLGATDDDAVSAAITLPFTFTFGGDDYTQARVSTNGWLTFGSTTNSYPVNLIDNAELAKPLLMPLWDDLQNRVIPRYVTSGTAPNRIFKVEWSQSEWSKSANGDVMSFQVWLYETTNVAEFRYKRGATAVGAGSATIGIYDASSTPMVLDGTGATPTAKICNTDFVTNLSAKPADNQVYTFTPSTLSSSDRWWLHVYDNNIVNINNTSKYVGYYSLTTSTNPFDDQGFDSRNYDWGTNGTPSSATGYIGCPTIAKATAPTAATGNDRFKYYHKRQGFDCGIYKVTMQLLDDSAKLVINGVERWGGSLFAGANVVNPGGIACSPNGCDVNIGYYYLDEEIHVELRTKENTGFTAAWMNIERVADADITYTALTDNTSQSWCIGNMATPMSSLATPIAFVAGQQVVTPGDYIWTYQWQSNLTGCGGIWVDIPGETNATLSPGIMYVPTYYRRKTLLCGVEVAASNCATIQVPVVGTTLGIDEDNATCVVNTNNWVHFYETGSPNRLLASIHSGGQDLGNVTVTCYVEGSPLLVPACDAPFNPYFYTSVLQRHWVVTPQYQPYENGNPGNPILVRLPLKDTELSALVTASGQNASPLDNVAALNDLKLSKYSGPNNVDDNALNNCASAGGNENALIYSGTGGVATPYASEANISVPAAQFKQFSIPGFSELWLHAQTENSPLPVVLTDFSVHCRKDKQTEVIWSTASESNTLKYTVEKSRDLQHWLYVSELPAAGNSGTSLNYTMMDVNSYAGISYYRLVQTDLNGVEKIYGPVSVSCEAESSGVAVFPNPVRGEFTVEVISDVALEAEIQVSEISGKIVLRKEVKLQQGRNHFSLDEAGLANGGYMVRIVCEDKTFDPVKFVVDK